MLLSVLCYSCKKGKIPMGIQKKKRARNVAHASHEPLTLGRSSLEGALRHQDGGLLLEQSDLEHPQESHYQMLTLPSLFPSMTRPDIILINEWKFQVGDVLPANPRQCLLKYSCPGVDEGFLCIPDFVHEPPHRIVEILKPAGTTIQLGDPLFVLEPVEAKDSAA
jgi:hypothetical protein